jgi:uncharacterized glyoxalase superfamily protein PhnB
MEQPTVFPVLYYDDPAAAIDFLAEAFGATRHAVYTGEGGGIVHAELMLGHGMVMLGPASPEYPATGGRGGGVYVAVEDPDAHFARARSAGAGIVRELHDTEYGSREYAAVDGEKNDWYFGNYQPFAHVPPAAG